jgi:chaperonin GroES
MSDLKFTPSAGKVLVEPAAAEEKTSGGIIIPDTAQEKPLRGSIIAIGVEKKDEPMAFKVGETVLYSKYGGTEIQIEGKDYLLMSATDIYGSFQK